MEAIVADVHSAASAKIAFLAVVASAGKSATDKVALFLARSTVDPVERILFGFHRSSLR